MCANPTYFMPSKQFKKQNKNKQKTKTARFGSAVPNQLYSSSFPREMKVTFNYSEFYQLTSTVGLMKDQLMNLNSIYDPNRTSTGHQPQGYDQWANFYNRYRVDGCLVTARFTTAPVTGIIISMLGNNDTTALIDPSVITESPLSITKGMSGTGPAVTISKYYDLANLNGVTRAVYNADDRYSAPFGSSPTETLICHIGMWNLASFTYEFQVEMKFYTTLFDPVQLPLS